MKVSKLIEILQEQNNPEDEIIVLWWEKKTFDYPREDEMILTEETWNKISKEFDEWDEAGDEIGQWIHGAVIEYSKEKGC